MFKAWLDHWIFKEYRISTAGLGLFRIAYVLFILLFFGLPDFSWIAGQPDYYFDPRLFSVTALMSGFPSAGFFWVLQILIAVGYAFLLIGYKTRAVSVLLPLLVMLGNSFSYSFGKIDHDLFAWLIPLLMAGSSWGLAYSVDARRFRGTPEPAHGGWPLNLLALLIAFGMFTAALPKMMGGWLSPDTQAVQAHFHHNYYVVGRQILLAGNFADIPSVLFWELMDWTAILFEFSFVLAVLRKRWFGLALFVATVFHLLNMLMLNIPFTANLAAYMAFLPWDRWSAWMEKKSLLRFGGDLPAWSLVPSLLFVALCAAPAWLRQPGNRSVWVDMAVLSAALVIATLSVWSAFRRPAGQM